MVTLVGKQTDFTTAVKNLIELDYDAIEAYESAIANVEDPSYKDQLKLMKSDHERHVKELSQLLKKHNEIPPTGPSTVKHWVTKGKVVMAELFGDELILRALRSNEVDTNTAYERMNDRDDKWPDSVSILQKGYEDEKRHKNWLDKVLSPDSSKGKKKP